MEKNIWYNFKLTVQQDTFSLYMVKERDAMDPNKYLNMPITNGIEVTDAVFRSGHFGVFINYETTVQFDGLVVTPLPCKEELVDNTNYMLQSFFTSRVNIRDWDNLQ